VITKEEITKVEEPIVFKPREDSEMPFKQPTKSVEELKTKL